MIFKLKCPVCSSSRVKKGYRSTPFWSKMILRHHLLCEKCNWEFVAYTLPWNILSKNTSGSKSRIQKRDAEIAETKTPSDISHALPERNEVIKEPEKKKAKKKLRQKSLNGF